jgi:hypothetical protein
MIMEDIWTPVNADNGSFKGSGSLGMISPMAPNGSPFALMSPYGKMTPLFSPWDTDNQKIEFMSPGKGMTLGENRAELINMMEHLN